MAAAAESAELLGGAGRRVVVVAEVADPDGDVPMSDVVAVAGGCPTRDPRGPSRAGAATPRTSDLRRGCHPGDRRTRCLGVAS